MSRTPAIAAVDLRRRRRRDEGGCSRADVDVDAELVAGHDPSWWMQDANVTNAGSFRIKRSLHAKRPFVTRVGEDARGPALLDAQLELGAPPAGVRIGDARSVIDPVELVHARGVMGHDETDGSSRWSRKSLEKRSRGRNRAEDAVLHGDHLERREVVASIGRGAAVR